MKTIIRKIKSFIKYYFPRLVLIYKLSKNKINFIDYIEDIKKISANSNLKINLSKKPIIFDIGSNIGNSAIILKSNFKNSEIHCFEPIKKTFEILKKNLSNYADLKLNNFALGPKLSSEQYMHTFKHSNLISNFHETTQLTVNNANMDIEKVKSINLDQYCINNKIEVIDILRIDVNGYEISVLEGAKYLLKNQKIKFIHFSFYNVNTKDHVGDLNKISNYLEGNKYRLGVFYNDFIHYERNGGYYFATYFVNNLNS